MTSPKTKQRAKKTAQMVRTMNAVMDATIELLSEIGYRRLTIELISKRSNVARSTIYRHWRNIPELTIDAFDRGLGPNPETPDLGDIRSDLTVLYHGLSKILERSIWGRILPALIEASSNDKQFKVLLTNMANERRKNAREMLQHAVDRGEIKADTDFEWVLDAMSGPLYYRLLITGTSIRDTEMIDWLINNILSQILVTTNDP